MDNRREPIHLELVVCSSEDEHFPATNLTRPHGAQLAVWESEKFCEFPQELVFRVNRGIATRIEQVNLVSHPFKVATRMEIFTSSAASGEIHDAKTGVRFERLGFVSFLNNESMHLTACELQEVQMPRPTAKITLLRVVLHSCHQTRANLFSQVGLASVVALGAPKDKYVLLPMIPSPRKSSDKNILSPRQRNLCVYDTTTSGPVLQDAVKSPRAANIWTEDFRTHKTPEQVCAEIQIGKQLAQFVGDDKLVQPWAVMEQEANKFVGLLENKHQVHDSLGFANMSNTLEKFAGLEQCRQREEERFPQLMSFSSPKVRPVSLALRGLKANDVLSKLRSGQWQERETLLWQLAKCQQQDPGGEGQLSFQLASIDTETIEVLITALNDSNAQVFLAGCAFLRALLISSPYFQDTVSSKTDLADIVDTLLERLSSHEPSIRDAAAFTLLKIAGSTRTRGTFVTHLLLRNIERKHVQPSDQQLLALLKLLTALLLSFHCCASCDIAPRRIIRFLLHSDADQHENALVRDAGKQLMLALCIDVDEKFVLKNYVQKLPLDHQQRYKISF